MSISFILVYLEQIELLNMKFEEYIKMVVLHTKNYSRNLDHKERTKLDFFSQLSGDSQEYVI